MRKFQFKLQTLLKVREQKEKAAQQELAQAQQARDMIQHRIDALQEEGKEAEAMMREKKQRTFSAPELSANLQYLEGIRFQIARMQDDLFRASNIVAEKQQQLAEAITDRKALEKLKERRKEEWEAEFRREERKLADEHATTRFLHDR
jgi:flagellar FliJ protein